MSSSAPSLAHPIGRPAIQPVTIWAIIGTLSLLVGGYAWIGWILSPDFKPTHPPVPITDKVVLNTILWAQIIASIVTVVCIWFWVVRPKLKTGRFSFMGLLCLGSATTYWVDPLSNYYSFGIAYSSLLWNFGSWANFIPGWSYPGMQRMPEGPLFIGTTYVWFNLLVPVLFTQLWRWIDRRFPRLGYGSVICALFVAMVLSDLFQEVFYLRLQLYSYVGASHKWSLFGGHYYQFPIFVGLITGLFFLGLTHLMYSRDDKGYSYAERGVDNLRLSERGKTFVRFLALTGVAWVLVMVTYFLPVQWMYTHGDAIPTDTPSHLINGLCGAEAGFPCPGPGVPIPRRD